MALYSTVTQEVCTRLDARPSLQTSQDVCIAIGITIVLMNATTSISKPTQKGSTNLALEAKNCYQATNMLPLL